MKVIKFVSILFLLFFCSAIAVAEQYRVTAETLNVRQKASSKSTVLFKLSKGDIVESHDHGKWMEIDYNGQRGYAYSKYLKKVDSGSSSSYNDDSISWLPIMWMTLPLVIFFAILFWLHKYYRWSSLFYASIGSLIVIAVVPPLMKFLFGLFDYETIGKYVGWALTALIVYATFSESTKKAEKRASNTNTSTREFDNCPPPSHLDSEDYSPGNSGYQSHYEDDANDSADDNQDDEYDNYERERQEREEAEKKREQYDRYMREAEEAYRQYDYNKSEAEKALSNADIYIRSAEDNERRGKENDDESYFREAQNDRDMAESFLRDARQYQKQAKSYYCDYERAKREAESYR